MQTWGTWETSAVGREGMGATSEGRAVGMEGSRGEGSLVAAPQPGPGAAVPPRERLGEGPRWSRAEAPEGNGGALKPSPGEARREGRGADPW